MVKKGDIIFINLNPTHGHEQSGTRPALVVSADRFQQATKSFAIVCPISSTDNGFPLHVHLDSSTKTQGVILCEHMRSLDIESRTYRVFEKVSPDVLERVDDILKLELGFYC
ncbi:MAG: type II toxin-antitoxin system PemK/MazF family toxin [Lachnospiraceae bacterium]|nr:type II toxin-antitoxin system PemK/MazF family toxin [Lachnospiraceae bacterium]